MIEPEEFWWNNVTGPQAFIRQTMEAIGEGNSPVLQLPVDLPWRHCMRRAFIDKIRDHTFIEDPYFETIDSADECSDQDIGDFLLSRYAGRSIAGGYRPRSGLTVQQYMEKYGVLKGKLLWIKGIPAKDIPRWCAFCRGFKTPSLENGCFVLECRGELPATLTPQLKIIRLEDFVSRYDVQLFSAFLLSSQENALPKRWQNYVASVSSRLCGLDAELCESMILYGNWFTEDPRELFQRETAARKDHDGMQDAPAENTPYKEELTQRLWAAQIEILFPRIEALRIRIIDILHGELASALKAMPLKQFEQTVVHPEELELGTIIFLMNQRWGSGYEYLVSVPDEKMRTAIHTLRDCRNLLAHRHQCCTPGQVEFILTYNV